MAIHLVVLVRALVIGCIAVGSRRLSLPQGGQQLTVWADEIDRVTGAESGVAARVQLNRGILPGDRDDPGLGGHLEHLQAVNTSFNGFPALASFVAEDRFLPRPLTKRGHRLVFSNGIIVLTALAVTLLIITEAKVTALVPFFAIGVFTGFAMAGFGMAKHHRTHRGPGWQRSMLVNLSAGVSSTIVVGIFAVAKFTEGAWLIVVIFPLLVWGLIRLNQKYRAEAAVLEMSHTEIPDLERHPRLQVLVFVDTIDLAEVEAVRLGYGLHADELTAVHFVIDVDRATRLRERWERFEHDTALWLINCPDRHLGRAAHELVWRVLTDHPDSRVTVLLPRRTYAPLLGRLLHDRTADKMARAVSRIRGATAIIVPYDIESRIARIAPDGLESATAKVVADKEVSFVGD